MTYDSDSPTGQAYLTDAVLWLLGTPLAILDVLYLAYGAPPITPNAPETLVVWALGLIALALLAWNFLSSACAHLATLRHVPDPLRRAAHLLVSRFGTRLSRSLLARAGASALIGSALVTSVPLGGALAAPQDTGPRGVSLTWADSPETAAHTSPEASPTTSADAGSSTAQDTDTPGASLTWADTPTSTLATSPGSTEATPASAPGLTGTRDPGDAPSPPEVPDPALASRATTDMPETVMVAPGDSLWSIAASLQQAPTTHTSPTCGGPSTQPTRTPSPTLHSSTPDKSSPFPRTSHEHTHCTQASFTPSARLPRSLGTHPLSAHLLLAFSMELTTLTAADIPAPRRPHPGGASRSPRLGSHARTRHR